MKHTEPLDLSKLKVLPLGQRRSLTHLDEILVQPGQTPPPLSSANHKIVQQCSVAIRRARERNANVILMYGAHLVRNGAALIVAALMRDRLITHIATNGAGSIHDWEFAWLGRSTENVEQNVATGTFGTWDEIGRNIHLALLACGIRVEGYGAALARFIAEDGTTLPSREEIVANIRAQPDDEITPSRCDLLAAMRKHNLPSGRIKVAHQWKHASIFASAFRSNIPVTVHPGIGYDITSCHPMFNGAVIGRAAELDFKLFAGTLDKLDGGVVLSIGSAIMAPQVFEKALSCVHNLRFQEGRSVVKDFDIFVVDLQDGGSWDWSKGEPPKDNPAYYLRFCKSFSRMGGTMRYVQCDNLAFVHNLYHELVRS